MRLLYRYITQIIPPIEDGCYGYLYNQYAVDDVRNISANGWVVPSNSDISELSTYLGGDGVSGGKLKEVGLTYWNSPNTGATDEVNFKGRGAGKRVDLSGSFVFAGLGANLFLRTSTNYNSDFTYIRFINYNAEILYDAIVSKKRGHSIRLISDATGIPDGTQTTYTGNDGKIYPAIAINGKYWLQQNLEETQYRNGDPIPNVTDNTAWANLTTGAWCVYDNNDEYKCK